MNEYTLYSLPNCDKCEKVKEILKERNIRYDKVYLSYREGRRNLGEIYRRIVDLLERDEKKQPFYPILVKKTDSGIKVANIEDKIIELLEE